MRKISHTRLVALSLLLLSACTTYELPSALGEQCDLNSDCDAPLVCALGYCRVECATSRDCAAGLDCLEDNMGRGGCQLVEETQCTLDSDCPASLVCTRYPDPVVPGVIRGECTNECACAGDSSAPVCTTVDCPPGAACVLGMDGTRSCLDTSTRACVYDSDCAILDGGAQFEVCAPDQRCRIECAGPGDDANCRNGETCQHVMLVSPMIEGFLCLFTNGVLDAGVSPDAGARPDGGVAADGGP